MDTFNNLKQEVPNKETSENGFIFSDTTRNAVDCVLTAQNIPVWAKEDLLIKEIVDAGIGNFIYCRSYWDELIDQFKPPYHRGYIYYDGEKYYVKRWKINYISWTPIKLANWYNATEEFEIEKENYNDLVLFSKEIFLNKEK